MSLISRYRLHLLVASLIITAGLVAIAPMLPMSADVTEFLPDDEPAVTQWVQLTNRFGALDILMVGLEEPGEGFQLANLKRLATITNRLSEHKGEGLALVRSLTNLDTIRQGEGGTIEADLLINRLPESPDAMDALEERVRADAQAPGSFVSKDLRAYVILIKLDAQKDSRALAQLVRAIVEEERGELVPAYFGAPFIETMITDSVYRQVPLIAGLFALLLLIPLFMLVGRITTALLVIGVSGVAVGWWLGLLQLLGIELTATASGAALVLLAVASLLYARLVQLHLEGHRGALAFLLLPLVAGTGLLLLTLFPIPFLAHFGQVASVGMLAVSAAGALLLTPAATWLRALPPKGSGPSPTRIQPAIAWSVAVLLLAGGTYGASQGQFLLNPRELFSRDDEVGHALAFFDHHLGGGDVLQISATGDFRKPANCARVMRLTDLLMGEPLFADVRSFTQVLGMLSEQFGGIHRIPTNPEALNNLWFFVEGNPDLRAIINDDRTEAMIAARIFPQTDLAMSRWAEVARQAVVRSADVGRNGVLDRLQSLARHLGLHPREHALADLVDAVLKAADPTALARRKAQIIKELKVFMHSDQSPFEPAPDEWRTLQQLLQADANQEVLARAIAAMPGFIEWEYPPDVANELAAALLARTSEQGRARQIDAPLAHLREQLGQSAQADAYLTRARGILAEFIDGESMGRDDLAIEVSGFPAVIPLVQDRVLHYVWLAALLLWASLLIGVSLLYRNGFVVLRSGTEALLATVLTFALGWLTRTHIDSASAVLYLLPPMAGFLASPALCLRARNDEPLPGNRLAPAVATALAAASLSLLVVDVKPIFRLGSAMAIGLLLVAIIAPLSRRVRR